MKVNITLNHNKPLILMLNLCFSYNTLNYSLNNVLFYKRLNDISLLFGMNTVVQDDMYS